MPLGSGTSKKSGTTIAPFNSSRGRTAATDKVYQQERAYAKQMKGKPGWGGAEQQTDQWAAQRKPAKRSSLAGQLRGLR